MNESEAPQPPVTSAPMSFTTYWDCLNSHAECCDALARDMLVAEGATPAEVEEIFANPDGWVETHGHRFNEPIAAREAMLTDYDPLKDKDLQGSMKALNSRAVVMTISAVSHLFHFRIAHANVDVFAASASVLTAWNLLFVAGTELTTGERAFAVMQAPRIAGARGGIAKRDSDPKETEKAFVKQCWHDWQRDASRYASKAAFARDMLTKCEHLTDQRTIEDWCREWKEGQQSASES